MLSRTAFAFVKLAMLCLFAAGPAAGQGFKFSQPDEADRVEEEARQSRIADQLSTPCRADLKGKKIMLVIGQVQSNGVIMAQQQNYGREYQAINTRLRAMGLTTFTPEEIRRQIAQAEIDAYFKNDPDAALAASKRLGASFILRGLITTQSGVNPMMAVNQVSINMGFTLTGQQRARHFQCRRQFQFLCRRRHSAYGAYADQRKSGRSGRPALFRLLHQCRVRKRVASARQAARRSQHDVN